jgi:hypothetical protein
VFCLAPPSDPDVWWHVRAGDLIRDTHRLPDVDTWSLVASGRDWVAHSWLAEVLLSLLHSALGLKGVVLFRAVAVLGLLTALAVQAFRRTTPARALLVVALAVMATRGGWGERPQLLSFLLIVPTAQLVRAAVEGRRSIWWVVPITFLWANLHGLWFLAPALVLLGAVGAWTATPRTARLAETRTFLLAAGASAAVAGLTPNGPVLLLQPLRVNGYAHFVSEWAPVDIHSVWGLGFFGMVLTFLVAYGRGTSRLGAYELASVCFAIALGLLYSRTVAPAAVLMTPLLAEALGKLPPPRRSSGFPPVFSRAALGVLLVLGLFGGTFVLTQQPDLPPAAPVQATQALLDGVSGQPRVLNEYAIGGWLLLFAPEARPAIDGRAEIYPTEYVGDYISALKMVGDWQRVLEPLQANSALLHPETPLANGLKAQLGWRTVYEDANWLVLVPPGADQP